MQTSASNLTDQFGEVLGRLPKELDLDGLAHQTGALRRGREIRKGADLLRLCLARGPGGLSLRETAAWASWVGMADISNPDVKGAESVARGAPVAGEIRIGDRYFAKARALQTYLQAGCGSTDIIVRMGWNAFRLNTVDGEPFDLIAADLDGARIAKLAACPHHPRPSV
jgi:hypothetical protein